MSLSWCSREFQRQIANEGGRPRKKSLTQRILLTYVRKLSRKLRRRNGRAGRSRPLRRHLGGTCMDDIDDRYRRARGFSSDSEEWFSSPENSVDENSAAGIVELMENVRNLIQITYANIHFIRQIRKREEKRERKGPHSRICLSHIYVYHTRAPFCLTLVFIEISTVERDSRRGAHRGFMSKRVKPQHTTLQMMLRWEKGWKKPPATKTLLICARKRSHVIQLEITQG